MPSHYVGDLLLTIGISGLSRVRTELLHLAVVPAPTPHPVQMHGQLAGHRDLGDLPSTPHGEVEELVTPFLLTTYRDLRRLHQQKPQQHIPLLADVSQSAGQGADIVYGIITLKIPEAALVPSVSFGDVFSNLPSVDEVGDVEGRRPLKHK